MLKFYRILLLPLTAFFLQVPLALPAMQPTPVRKRECIGSLPRRQRISPVTPRHRGMIFCRSIRRCTRKTATSPGGYRLTEPTSTTRSCSQKGQVGPLRQLAIVPHQLGRKARNPGHEVGGVQLPALHLL